MAKKNSEHDDAWAWDPTRPVAGQYEEHLELMLLAETACATAEPFDLESAAAFCAGDAPAALLDPGERIATQTRHDVAASVARHAFIVKHVEGSLDLPTPAELDPQKMLRHAMMFEGDKATLAEGMSERWCIDETIRVDMGLVAVDLIIGDEPNGPTAKSGDIEVIVGDEPEHGVEVALVTESGSVTLRLGNAAWHDGAGWYYTIDDYPDEGACGAFETRGAARSHAAAAGYLVDEPTDPAAKFDELAAQVTLQVEVKP